MNVPDGYVNPTPCFTEYSNIAPAPLSIPKKLPAPPTNAPTPVVVVPPAITLPPSVDLRNYCSPIEDQGQLGSCTGNAIAGAIELIDRKRGKALDVSRLFIYYQERLLEGTVNYDVYENYAIKTSEYGGVNNKNFIEFELNKSLLTGNPNILGIVKDTDEVGSHQTVPLYKLTNFGSPINDINILPKKALDYFEKLPSAGYVSFDDVKKYCLSYDRIGLGNITVNDIYQGDYIWLANENNTWKVLTPVPIGTVETHANIISVRNNFNNTVTFVFDKLFHTTNHFIP